MSIARNREYFRFQGVISERRWVSFELLSALPISVIWQLFQYRTTQNLPLTTFE